MTIFDLRPWARVDNIVLAHDYLCPWCWVGFFQAQKLTEAFGVRFEWVGAELYPPDLDGPESQPGPRPVAPPPAPGTPLNRFDQFCVDEGIQLPSPRPGFVRTRAALLGAEWAKTLGPDRFDVYNEAVYRAYWERCENIEDPAVVAAIAAGAGLDGAAAEAAIRAEQGAGNLVLFDDPAYDVGIRNVPTFVFGANEQLAEAHYPDLARATERFLIRVERLKKRYVPGAKQ